MGSSPDCDNNDLLAVSYSIERAGGTTVVVTDLGGNVESGDAITATLTVAPECGGDEFSLVSYEAPSATFSRMTAHLQVLFDSDTDSGESTHASLAFDLVLGPVMVPGCFFQADLVRGEPIEHLGPANSTSFYSDQGRLLDADNGGEATCESPPPPPDCPGDLQATANGDASITLSWSASAGATSYGVYRDGVLLDEVTTTTYNDTTTEAGTAYAYVVTAIDENGGSEECARVEVTAIPFFGAPILGALALLGGVGIYAVARRRS